MLAEESGAMAVQDSGIVVGRRMNVLSEAGGELAG